MTNELRETSARVLGQLAHKSDGLSHDCCRLADAYLSEHPSDDDTPIDEAWLKSIANDCEREPDGEIAAWFDTSLNQLSLSKSESSSTWSVSVMDTTDGDESASLPPITTRGQLRRLCKSLGIELRDGGR